MSRLNSMSAAEVAAAIWVANMVSRAKRRVFITNLVPKGRDCRLGVHSPVGAPQAQEFSLAARPISAASVSEGFLSLRDPAGKRLGHPISTISCDWGRAASSAFDGRKREIAQRGGQNSDRAGCRGGCYAARRGLPCSTPVALLTGGLCRPAVGRSGRGSGSQQPQGRVDYF